MKRLTVTGKWAKFPPTEDDRARLAMYARMEKLYKTEHSEVFGRAAAFILSSNPHIGLYIPVNMCALVANKQADFLFGEDLRFKSPSENDESSGAINAIVDRSRLAVELRTGEINGIATGGTVLKVRYSPGGNGEERGSYIEAMPCSFFFPQLDASNARRMEAAAMAYVSEEEVEEGKTIKHLRREVHTPGKITSEAWDMTGNSVGNPIAEPVTEDTGYDGLLLFYIPNNRFGSDFWGISDFKAFEELQNEINYAVSQLGLSMNKYVDPLLVAPAGTMKKASEIEKDRGRMPFHPVEYSARILRAAWAKINPNTRIFPIEAKVVEGDPESMKNLPRYAQPSADFASRLNQIEKLQRLIMAVSETNASALGFEENGLPESGRALRIRMAGPLAKVKRKMQFWHPVLVEAMYAARVLEYNHGMGPEPERPVIIWPDGLPEDEREQAEIAVMMKNGGVASQKTAVAKALQLEGTALETELEEIEKDKSAARERFDVSADNFFPPEDDTKDAGEDESGGAAGE